MTASQPPTPLENPHQLIRYFENSHLKPPLAGISQTFKDMALYIDSKLPDGSEKSTSLRKLLEAKDAAVRAALDL
jgi:hypothetical protein